MSEGGAPDRYDEQLVAERARAHDPGLPAELALELAVLAWDHLRAVGELDAPEVARRLLADHRSAGATPATVVARAAVEHCRERGIAPR